MLDPISEQATKDSLSYVDFLDRLLEAEASSRAERRLLAKTRLAHFPFHKTLAVLGGAGALWAERDWSHYQSGSKPN